MRRVIAGLASGAVAASLGMGVVRADDRVINFEEFPADNANGTLPTDRYADLGVTFIGTDDGSTWDGISNGDPGTWLLEGSNGPTFSGFNGGSYSLTMLFNTDIFEFSVDADRAIDSAPEDTLTVQGWNNGVMVDSVTMTMNGWTTFTLSEAVDVVVLQGNGEGFHPFGVDNIRWCAVAVASRKVDIGTEVGGNLDSLSFSDEDRLEIASEQIGGKHRTKTFINISACTDDPQRLDLRVETGADRGNIKTRIMLYDFDAEKWRIIDEFTQTRSDSSKRYANLPNPGRFVRESDGKARVQIVTVHADRSHTIAIDLVRIVPEY